MTSLQQLRDKLREGLYLDNLWQLARLSKDLAMDDPYPLPFFVMRQVFLEIARNWEDRPLPVEEANLVRSTISKPLEDLIEAIEAGVSKEELFDVLNEFVSAFLTALT